MREKFEDRLMKGKIKISCKKEGKKVAVWEARKEDIIAAIMEVTTAEMAKGFSISLRGLFYKLVSQNLILNYLEPYQKLSSIVDDCKYSGLLDWNAIKVDGARGQRIDYSVDGIPDALNDTITQYKLDRQEGQFNYIEVWCEKETLVDILRRVTDKYHLPLCIVKGRNSSSAIYKGYQRFREEIDTGRPAKLVYIGDHDPSGLDMIRDIEQRISFMLKNSTVDYSRYNSFLYSTLEYKSLLPEYFEVMPIALTMHQVKRYNLPDNYAKETDKLFNWYLETYKTDKSWEVDALDSSVLTELLEKTVTGLLDLDLYENILQREAEDKQKLVAFINTM